MTHLNLDVTLKPAVPKAAPLSAIQIFLCHLRRLRGACRAAPNLDQRFAAATPVQASDADGSQTDPALLRRLGQTGCKVVYIPVCNMSSIEGTVYCFTAESNPNLCWQQLSGARAYSSALGLSSLPPPSNGQHRISWHLGCSNA